MLKDVKVGDWVWSVIDGWGKVIVVDKLEALPILVKFEHTSARFLYTGKYLEEDMYPTIYWNEFKIPQEAFKKPFPDLKVDTKVRVWDGNSSTKVNRYFSHFNDDGKICCFTNGATSWSDYGVFEVMSWSNWELAENE